MIVTDRFHVKMLPYTEGSIEIYRSSPVDVKRAIKRGAETYIYKEETAEWLRQFINEDVEVTTEPVLLSRDEVSVIYVIFRYGELRYVLRMVYRPVGFE